MNKTNPRSSGRGWLVRLCASAVLTVASVLAFAQTSPLNDLVGPTEAIARLQQHYAQVQSDLQNSTTKSNVELNERRADFSMHILEDVQAGVEVSQAIESRLNRAAVQAPAPNQPAPAQASLSAKRNYPEFGYPFTASGTYVDLNNPVVSEVVTLLKQ